MYPMTNSPDPSAENLTPAAAPLEISTFSYEERRVILPAVIEALEHCGCFLLDRKPTSFTQMEFCFELHAFAVVDLYAALIAAGLELTRSSHEDLTTLCTVRRYNVRPSSLPSLLTVCLQVNFLDDIAPSLGGMGAGATA